MKINSIFDLLKTIWNANWKLLASCYMYCTLYTYHNVCECANNFSTIYISIYLFKINYADFQEINQTFELRTSCHFVCAFFVWKEKSNSLSILWQNKKILFIFFYSNSNKISQHFNIILFLCSFSFVSLRRQMPLSIYIFIEEINKQAYAYARAYNYGA